MFEIWGNVQLRDTEFDPDLQLVWAADRGGSIPTFAMEVGFSESTKHLTQKVKDIIRQSEVRVVLMIDIKEKPEYHNPLKDQQNIDLYKSEVNKQSAGFEELAKDYCEERPFSSPVVVYGIQWTGELIGSVQVFTKDPITGEPVEKTDKIAFFGSPEPQKKKGQKKRGSEKGLIYNEYPDLGVKLSDFVPLDDDLYKRDLTLDWDLLRRKLGWCRRQVAYGRYCTATKRLKKDGT